MPGIPPDHNRTLELYVCGMETPHFGDIAGAPNGEAFCDMLFSNLVGVVDTMELDGLTPISERLRAALELPACRGRPDAQFAELYRRARLAYVKSSRAEAAKCWRRCSKFEGEFSDRPLMLSHVEMARHRVAIMQNTLECGGEHGMIAVNQEHQARLAALDSALDADPSISKGGTYAVDGEPDRQVITVCATSAEAELQVSSFLRDAKTNYFCGKACHSNCAFCGKGQMAKDLALQRCAKCHSVYYCSRECQKSHWPAHKAKCKAVRGKENKKQPADI